MVLKTGVYTYSKLTLSADVVNNCLKDPSFKTLRCQYWVADPLFANTDFSLKSLSCDHSRECFRKTFFLTFALRTLYMATVEPMKALRDIVRSLESSWTQLQLKFLKVLSRRISALLSLLENSLVYNSSAQLLKSPCVR